MIVAGNTLTIAQIAQALGLPESTVRYYRDHFPDYIPVLGEGRQRRYPAEAVEVFRVIADTLRKDHGSAAAVEETLSRMFPRAATVTATPPQAAAETQQSGPQLAERVLDVLETQARALEALAAEVAALKAELSARDAERDRRLEEHDRAIVSEIRAALTPKASGTGPFWQRLFRASRATHE